MATVKFLALRSSFRRVYVFYTPGPQGHVNRDLDLAELMEQIQIRRFQAHFANTAICSAKADDKVFLEFEQDWEQLKMAVYGQVWFYGSGIHTYTLMLARLASDRGMEIVNLARKDSSLDRVLKDWYERPRDSLSSNSWL